VDANELETLPADMLAEATGTRLEISFETTGDAA